MANSLFVLGLLTGCVVLLRWAWTALPSGQWQMVAALPVARRTHHSWQGMNLTYYGFWTATAVTAALTLFCLLMGAIGAGLRTPVMIGATLLGICLPAAKLLARLIEGKAHGFTVGGASFVGFLFAPAAIWGVARAQTEGMSPIPLMPALASLVIAYAIGEGLGRFACISFGCCYGKPLAVCSPWVRRLFSAQAFRFYAPTQKAVYQAGLAGEPLVPIQGLTAAVCLGAGLLALAVFLTGWFPAAFLIAALGTQGWRVASEWLRADIPHAGVFSAYQIMAALNAGYAVLLGLAMPTSDLAGPDVAAGFRSLWDPALILMVEALWVLVFFYTGRSMVTASTVQFDVVKDRI